jgi:FAD:protein FMN transferase
MSTATFDGKGFLRFQHRAMATVFEVLIAHEDPPFAEQAALAAFQEIDSIEHELSRYIPNSDIARINNLQPHASVRIGLYALHCLQIAAECTADTGGAFDVTVGSLVECWVAKDRSLRSPGPEEIARARSRVGISLLSIDAANCEVSVADVVPHIDLGAIGKGYAVDRAIELLREWGVGSALVHGGTSSVFAFAGSEGGSGWPVTLSFPGSHDEVIERVLLCERSLGGSGIRRGMHIIDTRTGWPVESRSAAWVCADSATRSDAVSTACMTLSHEEIARYCATHPGTWAIVVEGGAGDSSDRVFRFGFTTSA